MNAPDRTTIAAISSPPGPGERGLVRISGPEAARIVRASCRFEREWRSETRMFARGRFDDGVGTQPLLLVWMPGPRSFTREDVAELHLPGSPPLLAAALARVLQLGAQLAQPGEFTRRAFENGRIDLAQAEGVLDLIRAANDEERRAATSLLFGGLSERVTRLRERLLELRALCEASLDFDEADTGHVPREELHVLGLAASAAIDEALSWEVRRAVASSRPRIVLVGAPNAGKSSLFNALGAGRALVSDVAGTTRDTLRALWPVAGVECELIDTAGVDDAAHAASGDAPERGAQELARFEHATADLLLWVVDARRRDHAELAREGAALPVGAARVLVWSQIDRADAANLPSELARNAVAVSALEARGFTELHDAVASALGLTGPAWRGSQGSAREISLRHRAALEAASTELARALAALERTEPLDLVAEGLRAATDALDAITGRTLPEDVLDRIFARFCLGK